MVPVVGEAADLINVGIHVGRGNWTEAAVSGAAAIPFMGMIATGGKFLKKAAGKVDDVGEALISKSDDLAEEVVRLCFPAGVLVDTESGHKEIQTVAAGEKVWAYDVVSSDWRLCRVLQTFERDYDGDSVFITVDGETIESTFRHPYWVVEGKGLDDRPLLDHHAAIPENATTRGRWVDAGDLQAGDILLLRDGRQMPVTSISTKPVVQKVYNFEVEELHNYAVGNVGILVHNNNGDEAATTLANVSELHGRQLKSEFTGSKIKKLKRKMQENGFDSSHPIIIAAIDGKNIIIDGHHRARAAGSVGITQVPVIMQNVSPSQATTLLEQAAEAAQNLGLPF